MIKGIDVSTFQGLIDWAAVAADGIKFAIIRLGFGRDFPGQDDDSFERNYREARANGIAVGAYLYSYAKNGAQAIAEAQHALRILDGRPLDLPLFIDCEEEATQPYAVETSTAFCDWIKSQSKYEAGIYASASWFNFLPRNYVNWIAAWGSNTGAFVPQPSGAAIHQYCSVGYVSGIQGNVDMDYLYDESLMTKPAPDPLDKYSDQELAEQVIAGKFGNGGDRAKALGARYSAVQDIVNDMIANRPFPDQSDDELARRVIRGEFGNGERRRAALGSRFEAVQARVNAIMG